MRNFWVRLCGPVSSYSKSKDPNGSIGVYVGRERKRFVIPARFVNLPVFMNLFDISEEEFGYQSKGAIVLHCDAYFFDQIVRRLKKDQQKYGQFSLQQFLLLNIHPIPVSESSQNSKMNIERKFVYHMQYHIDFKHG
ncbi:hypothetical protein Fmac_030362 [Flemingia macrophylla]|uniref:Small auxin up regulated protein n=1 Tax=Flemingia macrophylla TaxID=520843 RepID=A0ABD1LDJ5_9FABA